MSRWWLLLIPFALAIGLFGLVRWLDRPVELPPPAQVTAAPELATPIVPSLADAPRVDAASLAILAGKVTNDGEPAADAEVVVRGIRTLTVRTDAAGAFSVELPAPQEVLLSARLGTQASELAGPIPLAPGQRVEGLTLRLLSGASVEGIVLDAHTRAPVAGAKVITSAGTRVTAADGKFEATALSAGRNWLTVEASGFLPRVEWLVLQGARAHRGLELALVRAAKVEGRVTRMGAPVAGVAVWAERSGSADRQVPAMSDDKGLFTLESAPGTLQLYAAAPNQGRVAGPVLQLSPGQPARADFELGEALEANGIVTLDGQPLAEASLTAHDAQSQGTIGTTSSEASGAFRFGSLAVGRYLLSIRAGAGIWEAGPFEQTGEGSPWHVSLTSGGLLSGRVLPAAPGIQVSWKRRSPLGEGARTATDVEGRFSFAGVPGELVTIEAQGQGGSAAATGKPGDKVELRLAAGALKVSVASGGTPVTDFHVRAREVQSGTVREADVLSPQGSYRIEVPPGAWEIWIAARGFAHDNAPARATVAAAEVELAIDLKAGRRIRGVVKDITNGAPLGGVSVRATRRNFGLYDADDGAATLTDSSGRYELPQVVPGSGIVMEKPGYIRANLWPWQVARGNPDAFDIPLTPRNDKPDAPQMNEPYEGVGMQLAEQPGRVVVAQVFPRSPAEVAGVRQGDVLVAINGDRAAPPLDQVIARIRGPAGSLVKLDLQRGEQRLEAWTRRASIRP
jgi:hypothetical protein